MAIARALIHGPRLVVCDEPTASLDAATGQAVVPLLREVVREPGRAVAVVTHDECVHPFADRIAHMEDGPMVRVETQASAAVRFGSPSSSLNPIGAAPEGTLA